MPSTLCGAIHSVWRVATVAQQLSLGAYIHTLLGGVGWELCPVYCRCKVQFVGCLVLGPKTCLSRLVEEGEFRFWWGIKDAMYSPLHCDACRMYVRYKQSSV